MLHERAPSPPTDTATVRRGVLGPAQPDDRARGRHRPAGGHGRCRLPRRTPRPVQLAGPGPLDRLDAPRHPRRRRTRGRPAGPDAGHTRRRRAARRQHPRPGWRRRPPSPALPHPDLAAVRRCRQPPRPGGAARHDDRDPRVVARPPGRCPSRRPARRHDHRHGCRVHRPLRRAPRLGGVRARDPPPAWPRVLRGAPAGSGRRPVRLRHLRAADHLGPRADLALPRARRAAARRPRVGGPGRRRRRARRRRVLVPHHRPALGGGPDPDRCPARPRRRGARRPRPGVALRAHERRGADRPSRDPRRWPWARSSWPRRSSWCRRWWRS